jgi:hypothetical protein
MASGALTWWVIDMVNIERENVARAVELEKQNTTEIDADRATKALLRDTREARMRLADIAAGKDAIAIISMLEGLGRSAQAPLVVDTVGVDASLKGTDLRAVNVMAHAEGTFLQMFTLLQYIEAMPAPGTIDAFELVQGTKWRLTVRMHILTKVD